MKMPDLKKMVDRFTQSKPATVVLSVAMAILLWFIISVTLYPTVPVTIYHVPLVIKTEGTQAAGNGLSVVSCDVESVTVQVVGSRSQVGKLTAENLTAYVNLDQVTAAGEYPLDVSVESSENVPFELKSVSPSRAKVMFDKIETRSFPVTPAFPNIVISSGHIMDEVTCEPSAIDITGPSALLDEITKVVVTSQKTAEIDSSYVLNSSSVTLYNADNAIMDSELLEMMTTNFKINIPLLTQKELALTYKINNTPSGFDVDWLTERLQLSAETITLASSNHALAQREDFNLGVVNLDAINLKYSQTFDVTLGEGEINQSGVQQVTLSLNSEGLEERKFAVNGENIIVVNKPANYDFDVITEKLTIPVIGTPEELDELNPANISVTVDLSNYNAEQSESFSEYVKIAVIDEPRIWATGTHTVALKRVDLAEDTTDPEDE